MAVEESSVIAPRELILPEKTTAQMLSTAKKGTLAISGSSLAYHDGTNWFGGVSGIFTLSGAVLTFSGGLLIQNA